MEREAGTLVILVHGDVELASWMLRGGEDPTGLWAVDQLARLQVAAHRVGCSVCVRSPPPALRELLELVGLAEIVPEAGL